MKDDVVTLSTICHRAKELNKKAVFREVLKIRKYKEVSIKKRNESLFHRRKQYF